MVISMIPYDYDLKIGDTVRYLRHSVGGDEDWFEIGAIYKVISFYNLDPMLHDEDAPHAYRDQVELIKKIKPTKLAKKMYPNAIEKEGWLIV